MSPHKAGTLRTYGAGLLSSFGEITQLPRRRRSAVRRFHSMGAFVDYEISTFQEVLFATDSFDDAEETAPPSSSTNSRLHPRRVASRRRSNDR